MDQVRAEIRARHYSRRTEDAYVHWIRRYIAFHRFRHPKELGASDIGAFLSWLAVEKRVAAATQNQAFSAVLFLYRDVLRVSVEAVMAPHARMPAVTVLDCETFAINAGRRGMDNRHKSLLPGHFPSSTREDDGVLACE